MNIRAEFGCLGSGDKYSSLSKHCVTKLSFCSVLTRKKHKVFIFYDRFRRIVGVSWSISSPSVCLCLGSERCGFMESLRASE